MAKKRSKAKKPAKKSAKKVKRAAPRKVLKKSTKKKSSKAHKHRTKLLHDKHTLAHELGTLAIRFAVGIIFLAHGFMKLFYMGFDQVANMLSGVGVPYAMQFGIGISLIEFVGGLFILFGFLTRWSALILAIEMFFAWMLVHAEQGFFITQTAFGYEFVLLLMLVCVGLFFHGAGMLSLEKKLLGKEL